MANALRDVRSTLEWQGDSARLTLFARTSPGHLIYSIEAIDTVAGVAARGRYALQANLPETAPWLSDILVCTPFHVGAQPARFDDDALRARSSLRLARGDTLGIYAEAYRVTQGAALEVELAIEPADPPTIARRLFDWVGRTTGLGGPSSQPRVAWRAEATNVVHAISVNLPLDPRLHGRHVLVLRVRDPATGVAAVSRRLVLIAQ
jgi:hypothetical protein